MILYPVDQGYNCRPPIGSVNKFTENDSEAKYITESARFTVVIDTCPGRENEQIKKRGKNSKKK